MPASASKNKPKFSTKKKKKKVKKHKSYLQMYAAAVDHQTTDLGRGEGCWLKAQGRKISYQKAVSFVTC